MTDRPIIFSSAMVRALLAGTKTQTRRLATSPHRRCEVGDRLYVRESWRTGCAYDDLSPSAMGGEEPVLFEGDGLTERWTRGTSEPGRLRPGMHMPRWASRLTLTVEAVRVGPLQAISEDNARAEGARDVYGEPFRADNPTTDRRRFELLWDSLHTTPGERWDDNPDVVALTFRVEQRNIDLAGA